jgi:hypothetical protein
VKKRGLTRSRASALARWEEIEERAHARFIRAIEAGDPFRIRRAQEFYLKSSEVLRRLDIAVLTERRQAGEQVPKFLGRTDFDTDLRMVAGCFSGILKFRISILDGDKRPRRISGIRH